MKTIHLAIITSIFFALLLFSQPAFAQTSFSDTIQNNTSPITKLSSNGAVLIINQTTDKLQFKMGEPIVVHPRMANVGSSPVYVTNGLPLFHIEIRAENGTEVFDSGYSGMYIVGWGFMLNPGATENDNGTWEGYAPVMKIGTPGKYYILSESNVALYESKHDSDYHITSYNLQSLWSQPLEITVLPERYTLPAQHIVFSNQTATVEIENGTLPEDCKEKSCLDPENLSVSTGTTVTWYNHDMYGHTITSGKPNDTAIGKDFDSGVIRSGGSFNQSFSIPGNFSYFDEMRPWITGEVTVYNTRDMKISGQSELASPLQQYKSGIAAEDVKCNEGLQLIIKSEDGSPACVEKLVATKLSLWRWMTGPLPKPYIDKINITGLQQSYTVGQFIKADVTYTGYYWYTEPEVKILDANGTQVWFNCSLCNNNNGPIPIPSVDTFTYHIGEYPTGKLPVLNKIGTYTMVATLENKTAEAEFDVPAIQNTILTASFEPCDTLYPQSDTGIPVLFMPANSTGKICVKYSNPNEPFKAGFDILEANNYSKEAEGTTVSSVPDTVPHGNSTVVYTINSGPKAGFFRMLISCPGMQLAIGYDNSSNFVRGDFPWLDQSFYCGIGHDFQITGTSGIGVKYLAYPTR